ncbi:putative rRNA processing protein EBP2 [Aphelenchoides avenae]|nr:putative rRNA processing protein EBP2 [Aphelenchus avenae]
MKVKRVKPTKSKGKKVRPAEDPAESVRLANPLDELKQEDPATTRGDEPMLDETASSDEGFSDSDQEVHVALKEGILQKNGLNILAPKKRPFINKVEEISQKLFQIKVNSPWVNTLDITVSDDLVYEKSVNDDFGREAFFYKQAQDAAKIAVPRLQKLGVAVFRPADYYAEMAKSDEHMQKVRRRLLEVQKDKDKRENARRLREEKRFGIKAQKAALQQKSTQKRKLMEAVKKHRKGMKAQLETMLNNASKLQAEEDDEGPSQPKQFKKGITRHKRDKKYGFGGQKKRSKRNDKESFESVIGSGRPKGGKQGGRFKKRR